MGLVTIIKRALGGPVQEQPKELLAGNVFGMQAEILHRLEGMMSALTDLQAAVSAAVAKIQALEAQIASTPAPGSVSDADAETLATDLNNAVNPPAAAPAAEPAPATPAA